MLRTSWATVALVLVAALPALAEDNTKLPSNHAPIILGSSHQEQIEPPTAFTGSTAATISPYLYLNRCTGGCTVTASEMNDARVGTSSIPKMAFNCTSTYPSCHLNEYADVNGNTGAAADAEWAQVVQCMKEVYSPFNVTVTDQKPTNGVSYTMAIIAGDPRDIGLGTGILGIAPLAGDCSAQDNVISFSFANYGHGGADRVFNLCWTAAQETAHAFGLDHEYMFSDGTSACNDPMTYRRDCGGEKFFRNKAASCGEDKVRPCMCGGSQNSHVKIKNVFGEGTSLIPPPMVVVNSPASGGVATAGQVVGASAGSKRGVEKLELWLNNYKWAEVPGATFGPEGQLDPSDYVLRFPNDVPDGVIDIVVKAFDDLGLESDSSTVTVTKGAPCSSATTCAKGQKCDAGKCFWDAPVGKLGEDCDYNQFCTSGLCQQTSDGGLCSQACIVGVADACPKSFECVAAGNAGVCLPASDGGGCCSVGESGSSHWWLHVGLSAMVFGFVVRRRRRR